MVRKVQSSTSRGSGFTLIEMLAVIVIMGILIAFAIPAVTALLKSGGVSAASRGVSNTLGLARQYAITHRVNTRVVFAYNDKTGNTAPTSNLWYIAYTVVANNPRGGWDYLGKWEFLPLGAIFLNATPANTSAGSPAGPFPAGFAVDSLQSFSMPFPATNSPTSAKFTYIEFNPTGADNRSVGQTDQITITEGFLQNAPSPTPFRTSSNFVNLAVDTIVGRVQTTRP